MTTLIDWAARWNIPAEALRELAEPIRPTETLARLRSEADVTKQVRYDASLLGYKLGRNNVGAGRLETGSYLRWGIFNDTRQMNALVKSSDLIGWRRVLITPDHVGLPIAQFIALECKSPGWVPKNNPHEQAQQKFLTMVKADGGLASFTTGGVPR